MIESNFVLARSGEHELILKTLKKLESIMHGSTSKELIPDLKNSIYDFKAQVEKHQSLEEEVIFPACLEAMPAAKIISTTLKLQKDHGLILSLIETIEWKTNYYDGNMQLRFSIENDLKKLITIIKKHAVTEVKDLFPSISNNYRCRELIDLYADKLNSSQT